MPSSWRRRAICCVLQSQKTVDVTLGAYTLMRVAWICVAAAIDGVLAGLRAICTAAAGAVPSLQPKKGGVAAFLTNEAVQLIRFSYFSVLMANLVLGHVGKALGYRIGGFFCFYAFWRVLPRMTPS
jgi:hypothetical protein